MHERLTRTLSGADLPWRRPLRILGAALCLSAAAGQGGAEPQVTLTSRLALVLPANVGGLSGIEVDAAGTNAVLLSDRGWLFRAEIARDANGIATALTVTQTQRIRHQGGEHRHPDSEGLAALPDGRLMVSAEDPTRLLIYQWGRRDPAYVPQIPTQRPLDDNSGLEALAVDSRGAAWTAFETPDGAAGFQAFWFQQGAWSPAPAFPATPDFSIVGADFDADDRLYVLERAFAPLGFRTQIRRVTNASNPGDPEVLLHTKLGAFDNLEGIAVSKTREGHTRISLVSDDNNIAPLRMELVEFVVKD